MAPGRGLRYIAAVRRYRLIAIGVALTGSLAAAAWVWSDYRFRPRLFTGPLVQMVAPDGFTLVWEMHPAQPATLRVFDGDSVVSSTTVSPEPGLRYEAAVTGLQPDRTYAYEISPGPVRRTVKTAPAAAQPFRLLALGDTGDGEWPQWRISRMLGRFMPDLIVHTGDLVYPRGRIQDYPRNFYQPYARLIDHVPLYPCLGNHDVMAGDGAALLDTFVLPANGPESIPPERVYWFDYAGVRFAAIDSNLTFEQLRDVVAPWLDQVLGSAGPGWKIVFFHEPIYTHGRYDEAVKMRESIGPVLDGRGVNLVLCGHNHMYERTHPLRGGQIVPAGEGTVYVTTAAGGANLYRLRPDPPAYLAAWDHSQHSFTIVDVSEDLLRVRQVGEDGRSIDDFHIMRGSPTTRPGAVVGM